MTTRLFRFRDNTPGARPQVLEAFFSDDTDRVLIQRTTIASDGSTGEIEAVRLSVADLYAITEAVEAFQELQKDDDPDDRDNSDL